MRASDRRAIVRDAIREAVEAAGGTGAALAARLGISRQAVHHWSRLCRVPPSRGVQIERVLGIPRRRFNPDLY
jgi:DNA-binding transcriptional regulator YdaS (Cro superfamily)